MSTVVKRWTYDDLLAMPEDNVIREIFDGELFVSPSPFLKHERAVRRLVVAIDNYLTKNPIGEVFVAPFDIVFAIDNVCEPDVFFVSNERSSILTPKHVRGVPDFVIEVISEFNRRNDEVRKMEIYDRFGVDEYWIADPDVGSIRIYRRKKKALALVAVTSDVATTPILPGLTINVAEIMA